MHRLTWELRGLALRHTEGSYATATDRLGMLHLFGDQLWEAGYRDLHPEELKGRHVAALLRRWEAEGLAPGTIKNRMSALRWWAAKVGRVSVIAKANAHYHIPQRTYMATTTKAQELPADKLAKIRNRYVRMSLRLQRAFGLRREESLKIRPWQADQGTVLVLQGSWTKGGRPRQIPIRTVDQRLVLDEAKALVKQKAASLIPATKTYIQQRRRYDAECRRAGLSHMHGLRHAYGQDRFAELAGFACPAAGGPAWEAMTAAQREADYDARLVVSEEMGHCRTEITAAYLGSPHQTNGDASRKVATHPSPKTAPEWAKTPHSENTAAECPDARLTAGRQRGTAPA